MKDRTGTVVSVVVLVIYGTLTFVAVPLHFYGDPLFIAGSGNHALVQHDDALHCKHRVIESHDDCTICSVTSHTPVPKVTALLPHANPKSAVCTSAVISIVLQDIDSSHSHRGPPAILS